MHKKRLLEFDVVRIFAAFAVLIVHGYAVVVVNQPVSSSSWWAGNIADSLARWCVPVFIMISGALLIRPETAPINLKNYYTKRLIAPAMILMFWGGVYALWYAKFQSDAPLLSDLGYSLRQLLLGAPLPGHLYYLLIAIGLYAITPFINLIVGSYGSSKVAKISIVLLIASCGSLAINMWILHDIASTNALTAIVPYVGYYLMGYSIRVKSEWIDDKVRTLPVIGLFMLTTLLIAITTGILWRQGLPIHEALYMYEYLNPLVIVQSIAVLVALLRLGRYMEHRVGARAGMARGYHGIIVRLSDATLGVYLVHVLVQFSILELYTLLDLHIQNSFIRASVVLVLTATISFGGVIAYRQSVVAARGWVHRPLSVLRRPAVISESPLSSESTA